MDIKADNGEQRRFRHTAAVTAAVLCVVLLALAYAGFSVWSEYKQTIIDNQKQQMLLTAQSLADNLEVLIEEYRADLDGLSALAVRRMDSQGQPDWTVFEEYAAAHNSFVYDVMLEDAQGEITGSMKGHRITTTYSVTVVDDRVKLYQSRLDNGDIYLVLKMKTEGGAVSMVIDGMAYYQDLISNIRLGTNGYVVVKDSKGTILMHPEPEQWGIDVIYGRHGLYPDKDLDSLKNMIDRQNKGQEGISEYYSYWWTKPGAPRVKKISAYSPARVGKDFLVVSAVIDYDDLYIPIAEGFLKLSMVFAGVLGALILLGAYMFRLILQRRKDTEEIAYLTELNRLLEEMHRSEETIAHQQRLQIMGTMTGGIAHEFNNLLTPIMGYAELLMLDLDEDTEDYDNASEIYEASVKAKEIIQQISSLSRKNMETAFKNLDGERMINRALKMVRSVCPAHIHLDSSLELDGACILGNETQMNQVILNICVNAIHAIGRKEGGILVKGSIAERQELERYDLSAVPGTWSRYVRLDIEDNGCGMSGDVLKQIFDPFFTTKKGGKGTGLGLALVEQIIISHKGYIFAESVQGEGSVFHIYLPVNEQAGDDETRAEGNENRKSDKAARKGGTGTQKRDDDTKKGGNGAREKDQELKLLIVDDNPKVLGLLKKNFARLKIPAVTAMNFEEAGRLLEEQTLHGEQPFDAVAVEQYIEGYSAVDFCMSIQGKYPGLVKIVMADRVDKELAEARQRRIIDVYIDKPVSDTSILKALKSCLNIL